MKKKFIRVPTIIVAEACARRMTLTGKTVREDGLEYWLAKKGPALAYDWDEHRYVTKKFAVPVEDEEEETIHGEEVETEIVAV